MSDEYADYDGPRCDFCFDVNPEWRYMSEAFDLDMLNMDTLETDSQPMTETWLLCWRCSTLISINDKVGLLNRVVAIHMHLFPDADPDAMRQMIKLVQDEFFAGRKGEAVRV